MLIYFAHPIDQLGLDHPNAVAGIALDHLVQAGHTVYDPARAWNMETLPSNPGMAMFINAINERVRQIVDVVVALVLQDVASIGVPAEIANTITEERRCIIICAEGPFRSLILSAWDYDLRQYGRGGVVPDITSAVDMLRGFE